MWLGVGGVSSGSGRPPLLPVALGPGIRHLTLVSTVCNERGRGFFQCLERAEDPESHSVFVKYVFFSYAHHVHMLGQLQNWQFNC